MDAFTAELASQLVHPEFGADKHERAALLRHFLQEPLERFSLPGSVHCNQDVLDTFGSFRPLAYVDCGVSVQCLPR